MDKVPAPTCVSGDQFASAAGKSALKQTCAAQKVISTVTPQADMCSARGSQICHRALSGSASFDILSGPAPHALFNADSLSGCQSFTYASKHENCGPLLRSEGHIALVYKSDDASGIEGMSTENLLVLIAIRGARRLIAGECDDSDRRCVGARAGRTGGAGRTCGTSGARRSSFALGWPARSARTRPKAMRLR